MRAFGSVKEMLQAVLIRKDRNSNTSNSMYIKGSNVGFRLRRLTFGPKVECC